MWIVKPVGPIGDGRFHDPVTKGDVMPSIFSKMIAGDIPCHKVAEDDRFLAFLDIRPLKKGHTLVIPKTEVNYMFDIEDDLLADLWIFARRVAKAVEKTVACKRVGVMVAGLEVPHAHIHLVPIDAVTDLNFANAKAADQGELAKLAREIGKNV